MGLIKPAVPDLDEAWEDQPRNQRMVPMVRSWAQEGFGTPEAVYVLYLVKIGLYILGGLAVVAATPGIGGLGDLRDWWASPILWQKAVVYTLLFEILGLGCGFGPLTMRFLPPLGAWLHWLRPGTIRLPPWPRHVPGTAGTRRSLLDVALYAGVVAALGWALAAPGAVTAARVVPYLVLLGLVGLRDKAIFLAGRTEVYGLFSLFLLIDGPDQILGAKLACLLIWWGAATSKLNRHFPHVVSVMMSNSPVLRLKRIKRAFHRDWPNDIRPSKLSEFLAHFGTVIEFTVPLVLLLGWGSDVALVAAIVMTAFHLHILTSIPMGVPLEWNVFMLFAIWWLFITHGDVTFTSLDGPWPIVVTLGVIAVVAAGNRFPDRFSFLPSMRYYAGNWATSMWSLSPEAVDKIEAHVTKAAKLPTAQLETLYGAELATRLLHKGYAFRSMHTHGRVLFGMVDAWAGPDHETRYLLLDGEFVAGAVLGWNFGEGHLHNEQLIDALQERCDFAPGDLRVLVLESQPFGIPRQEYRFVDAATGEFERGYVEVDDMLNRQPWDTDFPRHPVES